MSQYKNNTRQNERAAKNRFLDKESVSQIKSELSSLENTPDSAVAALSTLYTLSKQKKARDYINERLKDRTVILKYLESDNPKERKNAARLIGSLQCETDVSYLAAALEKESVLFCIPSLLLALGAVNCEKSETTLKAYSLPDIEETLENKKHILEITSAKEKALSSYDTEQVHSFIALDKERSIILRCPKNLTGVLCRETEKNGLICERTSDTEVLTKTSDYPSLFINRSFFEALLPIAKNLEFTPSAAADAFYTILPFLHKMHDMPNTPFRYRIELKGETDRASFSKEFITALSKRNFDSLPRPKNSISAYEIELRIEQKADKNHCNLYIKLYTYKDERFSYRTGSLPASINPATASAVIRFASEHLTENADVLDLCCGSATMLIERSKISDKPIKTLTGIEISYTAATLAKNNLLKGKILYAHVLTKDCKAFTSEKRFDEIICNLPFGNRVGSHENNEALYKTILDKTDELLKPNGIALFYTMEGALFKKQLSIHKNLKLLATEKTFAGGLVPCIFVIRKNQ